MPNKNQDMKVSDKASAEFRVLFKGKKKIITKKKIQLPRLKFLRMIICHKVSLPISLQQIQIRQNLMNIHMYSDNFETCKVI